MAKNPYSQGIFDGTTTSNTVFAAVVPEPEYASCVFDEATGDATGDIGPYRTVGIVDASGLDSDGRYTVGIHDPDATDGRETIFGVCPVTIEDVDPSRSPNVDCPVPVIIGGLLWRDILDDDDLMDSTTRIVLEKKGKIRFEGGES